MKSPAYLGRRKAGCRRQGNLWRYCRLAGREGCTGRSRRVARPDQNSATARYSGWPMGVAGREDPGWRSGKPGCPAQPFSWRDRRSRERLSRQARRSVRSTCRPSACLPAYIGQRKKRLFKAGPRCQEPAKWKLGRRKRRAVKKASPLERGWRWNPRRGTSSLVTWGFSLLEWPVLSYARGDAPPLLPAACKISPAGRKASCERDSRQEDQAQPSPRSPLCLPAHL